MPFKNGEKIDTDLFVAEFDESKLAEDEKYDGYYIICTNVVGAEKTLPDKSSNFAYYRQDGFLVFNHEVTSQEIIDIYGGLWKIEETFRIPKTGVLNLRPVFHSAQDRIRAHFLVCFVALVLERVLEYTLGWKIPSKRIQDCLSNCNATNWKNTNLYHISQYNDDIMDIFEALGINVPVSFQQAYIKKEIAKTKKKDYED